MNHYKQYPIWLRLLVMATLFGLMLGGLARPALADAPLVEQVADIQPGSNGSSPDSLAVFNNKLYFTADDGSGSGYELWVYDGSNPPNMVADINPGSGDSYPNAMVAFNNKLYFNAEDSTNGVELWVYDGSNPPSLVADIWPGSDSSDPAYLTVFNNKLYFRADDGTNGKELWVYDGSNPPSLVADIWPGGSSGVARLTVFNSKLYFTADDGTNGYELWVYDGSTPPSLVADIKPGGNSTPEHLTVFNNKLYFSATGPGSFNELWVYDGSTPPSMVADIAPGSPGSYPYDLMVFNNKLYFQATDTDSYDYELWVYDGSAAPSRAADIYPGSGGSFPSYLTVFENKLFFQAEDGTNGKELWVYDGSTPPSQVADINPGSSASYPALLTVFNNKLCFTADDGTHGTELWQLATPAMSITKTVSPTSAKPGDTITYTLAFVNASILTATNVVIKDSVPANITNPAVAASSGAAIVPTGAAPNFGWQVVANLLKNEGGVITLTGVLASPLAAGTAITNTAVLTATQDNKTDSYQSEAVLTVENVAPVAAADRANTRSGIAVTISPLTNDNDPNGDPLEITAIGVPGNGAAVISGTTQIVYTPAGSDWAGDVFTYTVTGGTLTDTATITMTNFNYWFPLMFKNGTPASN